MSSEKKPFFSVRRSKRGLISESSKRWRPSKLPPTRRSFSYLKGLKEIGKREALAIRKILVIHPEKNETSFMNSMRH